VAADNRKLYWGDLLPDRIQASGLSGGSVTELTTDANNPYGVAVDTSNGKLYFTSQGSNEVKRCNLDGSSVEVIASGADGVSQPLGVAIDRTNQHVYVADYTTDEVYRVDAAGGNFTIIASGADGLNLPISVAIDKTNNKLFINNQGTNEILKCNLDGSSLSSIVSSQAGLQSIDIHEASGFIFWVQTGTTDRVARAGLDGSSVTGIVTTGYTQLRGLVIDTVNDKVIFTNDASTDTITQCNLDGSTIETIYSNATGQIRDIDIDQIPSVSGGLDLFLLGPAGGSLDLFEHGFDQASGSIDFYINGHEPSSGSMDLFIQVPFGDSLDLFLKVADPIDSSMNLFIRGYTQISGTLDLHTTGHLTESGSLTLYSRGRDAISTSGDLFISGPNPISGGMDLYIANSGVISSWSMMLKGLSDSINDSLDLKVYGTTTSGVGIPAAEMNLFIQNSGLDVVYPPEFASYFPAFVKTEEETSPVSGYWPVFLRVEGSIESSIGLFIRSGPTNSGSFSLFIEQYPGWVVTPGWNADRGEWSVFTKVFSGVSGGLDLFLSGSPPDSTTISGDINLVSIGNQPINTDLDMFLFGISGYASGTMTLFIVAETGVMNSNSILYVHGY